MHTPKTRSVRISVDLADNAQLIGTQYGRKRAAQIEYWARIGRAYTEGTGITIPPPQIPAPQPELAKPLDDQPPKPVLTPEEVSEALLALIYTWKQAAFVGPAPEYGELARLLELITEGEKRAMRMSAHNLRAIDEARAFVAKYQSTYSDETDSP